MATAPPFTITNVISDFLGTAPTLDEIIAFKLPEALENRGRELLQRNREGILTPEERDEMEEFTHMGHFMNMVKLRARLKKAN